MGNGSKGIITGVLLAALMLAFGLSTSGRSMYCVHCGAHSYRTSWEFFGLRLWSKERFSESGYSRLYERYVGRDKEHKWQHFSSGRTALWNSRCGSGSVPMVVLLHPGRLSGVEKLGDKQRICTVIEAFDLERPYDHKAEDAKFEAVRTLGVVKTNAEAEAWWGKYGEQFKRAAEERRSEY